MIQYIRAYIGALVYRAGLKQSRVLPRFRAAFGAMLDKQIENAKRA